MNRFSRALNRTKQSLRNSTTSWAAVKPIENKSVFAAEKPTWNPFKENSVFRVAYIEKPKEEKGGGLVMFQAKRVGSAVVTAVKKTITAVGHVIGWLKEKTMNMVS